MPQKFLLVACVLAATLLVTTALAQSPPTPVPTIDPNAAIFYNVLKGCTTKDPSWSPYTPLQNWSGAFGCPGPLCQFILQQQLCNGPVDLTGLTNFNYFNAQISFSSANVTGTVDLTQLPKTLQILCLSYNAITGTVNLRQLPSPLTLLSLGFNDLSGTVDLTRLPSGLSYLSLNNNKLTGVLDLTQLPSALRYPPLLTNNNFSGTVSINASQANNEGYSIDLTGNPLFAVWVSSPGGQNVSTISVDPSVHVYATSLVTVPLRAGVFAASVSKHALRLSVSGTATLGNCTVTLPSRSWQVFTGNNSNYVADSGVVAAALAPCLPTTFGTPQYFLHPTNGALLLVTSGPKNVTFTRRSG